MTRHHWSLTRIGLILSEAAVAQQVAGADAGEKRAFTQRRQRRGSAQSFGIMKKSDPSIVMTDNGFYFEVCPAAQVRWSAIRRISSYKVDLLTKDEIRLAFEHDDSDRIFEISEEKPGFEEFKRLVEQRFSFPTHWWEAVLKPAFASNSAVLFSRAEQTVQPDRREDAAPG